MTQIRVIRKQNPDPPARGMNRAVNPAWAKRKTVNGRNYNGGRLANPYMSEKPGDVAGGIFLIVCFVILPALAFLGA